MTLLAPENRRLRHPPTVFRLDAPALALLRALATGGARHPVFGGPSGQAAHRLLVDQGAIAADGRLTPPTRAMLEALRHPSRRLQVSVRGTTERHRTIWIGDQAATVATPRPDGALVLRLTDPAHIGAELVSWLGVRPLPEREGRTGWSASPLDLGTPDARTAWVIERHSGDPAAMRWVAAVDAGREGWRMASGSAEDRQATCTFAPVGVAAIYVALSHLV